MKHTIDTLVSQFERGSLTRRQLVQALLMVAAKTQLDRRLGTDAREINRAVSGAGDPGNASVQRFVENNSHIAVSRDVSQAHQH